MCIYIYIYIYIFGSCIKVVSGERKQVFQPDGGEEKRQSWNRKLTLFLAAICYVVGLGNVWCLLPYWA